MTMNNPNQQTIDPELQHKLQQMRTGPPRNPDAAARGKAQFIAEVDKIVKEQGFSSNTQPTGGSSFYQRWKEKWNMATPRTRIVFTFVTAFVLVAVFLFSGAGMTVYASQSALPGDALYGVKTGVEQTRVNLARDAAEKVRLNLAFAERRLDEIARLIENKRFADIAQAVQEYEHYVQNATAALTTVAAGDPASVQELASQVAQLLNRYAQTLSSMAGALPDTARLEVERAIQMSNTAGNMRGKFEFVGTVETINAASWIIGGRTLTITSHSEINRGIKVGDLVEVEYILDANGNPILIEVELAYDHDDINDKDNDDVHDKDDDDDSDDDIHDNDGTKLEFTAIVEQLGTNLWVIGGRTLTITNRSEINRGIKVGDLVEVDYILDANGNPILVEVELAHDNDDIHDKDTDDGIHDKSGAHDNDDDDDDHDDDANDDDDD
ncbi:MAG: hypothetical protein IT308_00565 [Anaerolineaceae bacterium]|nr:hypothetical protein [Anaerolineaceae bacterium]